VADIWHSAFGTARYAADSPDPGSVVVGIRRAGTLISDQDAAYIDDPCTVRRTIFVPAESVGTLDFDITAQERDALYNRGLHAAQQFLESWNYLEYLRVCRGELTPTTET
jgi:NTE family protein